MGVGEGLVVLQNTYRVPMLVCWVGHKLITVSSPDQLKSEIFGKTLLLNRSYINFSHQGINKTEQKVKNLCTLLLEGEEVPLPYIQLEMTTFEAILIKYKTFHHIA